MDTGWAISEMMFMGVITAMGWVKPLSQPKKPSRFMLLYQMMPVTVSAHASVQLRSAVTDLKKPVMPISEPQMENRNMVSMKGVQWALCSPMESTTMLRISSTPFSASACLPSGRVLRLLPMLIMAATSMMVTTRQDRVVWVMLMPPSMGIV